MSGINPQDLIDAVDSLCRDRRRILNELETLRAENQRLQLLGQNLYKTTVELLDWADVHDDGRYALYAAKNAAKSWREFATPSKEGIGD